MLTGAVSDFYLEIVDWMFVLLQPPFTGEDRKRTMEKIINARLILPDYLTNEARELIRNVSIQNHCSFSCDSH